MATVHGGAGGGESGGEGGGEDDPKSSGRHCGGTAAGFDVVGLIVAPMLTLSMRARSCDRVRAGVVGLHLANHPVAS
jgi:hypothetical protein